uniref:Uncharacterized protein n=1 Tax=Nelumbo nucifera TaxID=4432 RepID=A0A822Y4R3_NELNU|nr:TPA_asm: hypothetical protein HUJ06_027493 [Nelumbo nucifera]
MDDQDNKVFTLPTTMSSIDQNTLEQILLECHSWYFDQRLFQLSSINHGQVLIDINIQ